MAVNFDRIRVLQFQNFVSILRSRTNGSFEKPFMNTSYYLLQAGDLFPAPTDRLLLSFLTAFVLSLLFIPVVIYLVRRYRLYDMPDARKLHAAPIPTMGGLAIVAAFIPALLLWGTTPDSITASVFLLTVVLLTALGIADDQRDLSARYKLMVQTGIAAMIAVAGFRIRTLGAWFDDGELPLMVQYVLTIFFITGITNAFNLIDGIDGLAGGIAFMSLSILSLFLFRAQDYAGACAAMALAGGVLGFLYFNLNPARIFMGDTGSLVIGFVIAVLGIRLTNVVPAHSNLLPQPLTLMTGLVLLPAVDMVRVCSLRMLKGRPPFSADRTHLHHLLTDQGISHANATRLLCVIHGLFLLQAYWLQTWSVFIAIPVQITSAILIMIMAKHLPAMLRRQGWRYLTEQD
ncbi:glycosyltransferase family 4 protein [Terrimonas ferruginea]|uniref:glycosyltransferase family 4 protein n=1 Tax=Terrimonas ferruginea TaxID=249 RepID=UPI00041F4F93|nr:MraY family glycosyltransferase [Terrimonas ferruginea]